MPPRRNPWRSDRGETLVELIVAVAILGLAAVAILAGLMLSVKSSDLGLKQATGGAYVRSFAEAIQHYVDSNGYRACASAAATYAGVAVPDLPAGYSKAVTSVQSWNKPAGGAPAWGVCTGKGVQRLDLKITTTGDSANQSQETLTVVLRQPCNGTATAAGANPCS
jgi:type II secretory pathway pseudopilin PulG